MGWGGRPVYIEVGATREGHYQCRLVLGLSWYCAEGPEVTLDAQGATTTQWTFVWDPPSPDEVEGAKIDRETLVLGAGLAVSFEETCCALERKFCSPELDEAIGQKGLHVTEIRYLHI